MTERGRSALERDATHFRVGPSALSWDGAGLTISLDEVAVPIPLPIRGTIRLVPNALAGQTVLLDAAGRHRWRPIAASATAHVDLSSPAQRWRGHAYFDSNNGDEALEDGFSYWTWSRASLRDGAAVLYEAQRRDGSTLDLALRFAADGSLATFEPPPRAALPSTLWRVHRETRSDSGEAKPLRRFEDAPFYARSLIGHRLLGEEVASVHESLDLDRFAQPWVRVLLPFRMPRRSWS